MNARLMIELSPEALDELAAQLARRIAPPPEDWIGVVEAARYLGCSKHRVYRLVSRGDIPFVKDGQRVLFKRQSLDQWLEGQVR